jgi:hypothetical protein
VGQRLQDIGPISNTPGIYEARRRLAVRSGNRDGDGLREALH